METTRTNLTNNTGLIINISNNARKILFTACIVFCLTPFASPAVSLLLGLVIAQLTGHPYLHLNHKATNYLLRASVVGLGFGTGE